MQCENALKNFIKSTILQCQGFLKVTEFVEEFPTFCSKFGVEIESFYLEVRVFVGIEM